MDWNGLLDYWNGPLDYWNWTTGLLELDHWITGIGPLDYWNWTPRQLEWTTGVTLTALKCLAQKLNLFTQLIC